MEFSRPEYWSGVPWPSPGHFPNPGIELQSPTLQVGSLPHEPPGKLHAVQGTLKSLLQHHNLKASIYHHSAFFMVQISHPYKTTGKTIVLTIWTFAGKVIALLINTLSRFVIAFLPRSKHLLIWRLQSPSAVILEPKKIKSVTVSIVSPSICHEVMGPGAMIYFFF